MRNMKKKEQLTTMIFQRASLESQPCMTLSGCVVVQGTDVLLALVFLSIQLGAVSLDCHEN